jgi:hypothetical protein
MNKERVLWLKGRQLAAFIPTRGESKSGFVLWLGKALVVWDWRGYRSQVVNCPIALGYGYGD